MPAGCSLKVLSSIEGDGGNGLEDVADAFRAAVRGLTPNCRTLVLDAVTASGKTKVAPSLAVREVGRTLMMTSVRVDVEDIAGHASVPVYWQTGGQQKGGTASKASARLHVVTTGVAERWLLNDPELFRRYEMVIVDEYDGAAHSATFAQIIARVRQSARRCMLVSATHTSATDHMLEAGTAVRFEYHARKHSLLNLGLQCPRNQEEACLHTLAANLLRRGLSSLVFLPGQQEVARACTAIGPGAVPLHGKCTTKEKHAAMKAGSAAKVVCSTSVAERGATIPGMNVALDLGICRTERVQLGVSESWDYNADESTSCQRGGRVASTGPGVSVRVLREGATPAPSPGAEDLAEAVIAGLEPEVAARPDFLARDLPEAAVAEAHSLLRNFKDTQEATQVFLDTPVSLGNALAVQEAARWGVRCEAAFVAMLVEGDAIRSSLTLRDARRSLHGQLSGDEEAQLFHARKLADVRSLHRQWEAEAQPGRSALSLEYLEEALAVCFAATPTGLCLVRQGVGYCAGVRFESGVHNGHTVALGVRSIPRRAAKVAMEFRVTPWVAGRLAFPLPTLSGVYATDSTVMCFRAEVHAAMRAEGIALVDWRELSGGWEERVAPALAHCHQADVALVFPNGNRCARQEQEGPVRWMSAAARTIAQSLAPFDKAAAFVGDAELAPGVARPNVYGPLIADLQAQLKGQGVPVVQQCAADLAADGVHWNAWSSGGAVQTLVHRMLEAARKVAGEELQWWHYVRNESNAIHYATCRRCQKGLTLKHVGSDRHRAAHCSPTPWPQAPLELYLPAFTPSQIEADDAAAFAQVRYKEVRLNTTACDGRLGLSLHMTTRCVSAVHPDYALGTWNVQQQPSARVGAGDKLVGINSVAVDGLDNEELRAAMRAGPAIALVFEEIEVRT